MSTDEFTQPLELADATFLVRFVSQPRKDTISEQCRIRRPGEVTFETDQNKFAEIFGPEVLVGWEHVTPLDALELGYVAYDTLPTDADGCVPYSRETAVKLYRDASYNDFRRRIDEVSASIAREVARAKKRNAASSATSSAPSA